MTKDTNKQEIRLDENDIKQLVEDTVKGIVIQEGFWGGAKNAARGIANGRFNPAAIRRSYRSGSWASSMQDAYGTTAKGLQKMMNVLQKSGAQGEAQALSQVQNTLQQVMRDYQEKANNYSNSKSMMGNSDPSQVGTNNTNGDGIETNNGGTRNRRASFNQDYTQGNRIQGMVNGGNQQRQAQAGGEPQQQSSNRGNWVYRDGQWVQESKRKPKPMSESRVNGIVNSVIDKFLTEDGGMVGGAAANASGFMNGANNAQTSSNAQYDVPFGGKVNRRKVYSPKGDKVSDGMKQVDMNPALDRKGGKNRSIAMNHVGDA